MMLFYRRNDVKPFLSRRNSTSIINEAVQPLTSFVRMANEEKTERDPRGALLVVQSMIDISADRLDGLRTQCATSAELTQQEIRTLEVTCHFCTPHDTPMFGGCYLRADFHPPLRGLYIVFITFLAKCHLQILTFACILQILFLSLTSVNS